MVKKTEITVLADEMQPQVGLAEGASVAVHDEKPIPVKAEVISIDEAKVKAATEAEGLAAQAKRAADAAARIDALSKRRVHWQDMVFKTSNDMLYAILADCYRLYHEMLGRSAEAVALRTALAAKLVARGIDCENSTHTMTKIVRCVFDGDRRRISAYSRALRAALTATVPAEKLAEFIYESGGVEELRLSKPSKSRKSVSPAEKAQQVKEAIKMNNIGLFDATAVSNQLDQAAVGAMRVLIATQDASAIFTVNAIISSDDALNAALVAYYSTHKDTIKSDGAAKAESTKAVDEEALLDALASEAATALAA